MLEHLVTAGYLGRKTGTRFPFVRQVGVTACGAPVGIGRGIRTSAEVQASWSMRAKGGTSLQRSLGPCQVVARGAAPGATALTMPSSAIRA